MRKSVTFVLAALAGGLAHCSTDEFTTPSEAGAETGSEAAAPDASAQDATPIPDAAAEADVFVPPNPLDCTILKGPLLCADFESAPFPSPFSSTNGTVTLGNLGYSPTHALSASLAKSIGAAAATLVFDTLDPGSTPTYRLSFAFRVENLAKGDAVRVGALSFPAASSGKSEYSIIAFANETASIGVKTASSSSTEIPLGPCAANAWHHVSIQATVLGSPSVTVTYDGVSPNAPSAGTASTTDKTRTILVGAQRSVAGEVATILVDDVLFTTP